MVPLSENQQCALLRFGRPLLLPAGSQKVVAPPHPWNAPSDRREYPQLGFRLCQHAMKIDPQSAVDEPRPRVVNRSGNCLFSLMSDEVLIDIPRLSLANTG